MKGFRVAEARARFGELLDQAEQGTPVIIERRGVRFTLEARLPDSDAAADTLFEDIDPAVMRGEWTWAPAARGLTFQTRRRRQR